MGEQADETRDRDDFLRSFPPNGEGSAESDAEFDRAVQQIDQTDADILLTVMGKKPTDAEIRSLPDPETGDDGDIVGFGDL